MTPKEFQQGCDDLTADVRAALNEMRENTATATAELWEALTELSRQGRLVCDGRQVFL